MLKNQLLVVYPLAMFMGLSFSQAIPAAPNVDSNKFLIATNCLHGCLSKDLNSNPVPPPDDNSNSDLYPNDEDFDNDQDFSQDQYQDEDLNQNPNDYYNNNSQNDNNGNPNSDNQ